MKIKLLLSLLIVPAFIYGQQKDTIITPSGLKYYQLHAGDGDHPRTGDKLKVYYTGKFNNGEIFDSNRELGEFKFTLGAHKVIPGWEEGFALMSKGEKGILIIPAKLAYGIKGQKDLDTPGKYVIPPNSDLIFEVELITFK